MRVDPRDLLVRIEALEAAVKALSKPKTPRKKAS